MQNVQYTHEFEYTENMVEKMMAKNPKFKDKIQEAIFDHDMIDVDCEYLSKLPVKFTINSVNSRWWEYPPLTWDENMELAKLIIENDWNLSDVYDWHEHLLYSIDEFIKMMNKLVFRLEHKLEKFSNGYSLVASKLSKMIVIFLDSLQVEIDGIVNRAYNDDDYLVECFLNGKFELDNYYLNESTLEVYKIEHM